MKTAMWKTMAYVCAAAVVATLAVAAKDVRTISIRDECDPATFNAAFGPPDVCDPDFDGDVTVDEFLAALADGGHDKWEFNNRFTEADVAVNSNNRGGETHSFTPVARFGGGFVEPLNMGQAPVPECAVIGANGQPARAPNGDLIPAGTALATLVPAGASSPTVPLKRGANRFMCCIHPWMQSTVVRR
jgi:hypothetical protein